MKPPFVTPGACEYEAAFDVLPPLLWGGGSSAPSSQQQGRPCLAPGCAYRRAAVMGGFTTRASHGTGGLKPGAAYFVPCQPQKQNLPSASIVSGAAPTAGACMEVLVWRWAAPSPHGTACIAMWGIIGHALLFASFARPTAR
jgi:hypothetical protein